MHLNLAKQQLAFNVTRIDTTTFETNNVTGASKLFSKYCKRADPRLFFI
jgi:hypothetical protein